MNLYRVKRVIKLEEWRRSERIDRHNEENGYHLKAVRHAFSQNPHTSSFCKSLDRADRCLAPQNRSLSQYRGKSMVITLGMKFFRNSISADHDLP